MTLFVDRKKAFETKFVHDANVDFKTEALRNRLLGQWVVDKLEISGTPAQELISSYTISGTQQPDTYCIVEKAHTDLKGTVSSDQISQMLQELTSSARLKIISAFE